MTSRSLITGIDIGTNLIKIVTVDASIKNEKGLPKIVAVATAESRGMRHGYITNPKDILFSLEHAIREMEEKTGSKLKKAFLAVGGVGLSSVVGTSATVISRADLEITNLDIEKVNEQCEKELPQSATINKKIIHTVPLQYKVDGKVINGNPLGMKGNRLEVKMLYIMMIEQHLNDIMQVLEDANIDIEDVVAGPMASSLVTLSNTHKIAGSILANIGSETVSVAIFENGTPVSMEVFPIGSTDITHDIALGLKVPIEEAEQIKLGAITGSAFPRRKLEEIVYARLSDIFDLIESHLKKIGRNGLLPAGIILTGGGSGINAIDELARASLRLPSRVGSIGVDLRDRSGLKDSTWAVAYGLCVFGMNADEGVLETGDFSKIFKSLLRKGQDLIKKFLP